MKPSSPSVASHYSVLIVGGGQAGLSASYYLQQQGIDHLVLEKQQLTGAWRTRRWDSFCLVTPNWQCALPGHPYDGDEPHGFMKREQIIGYLDRFIAKLRPPALEGVEVRRVAARAEGGFSIETSQQTFTADAVIMAAGGYQTPIIPRLAERLPAHVHQLHSEQYRNPQSLPPGNVLVVGSGQSGAQIAEDLHLTGRKVYLALGDAPRCARFYRGRDVVDWLADMGYYDLGVAEHPLREGVRDNTNHYVTGRDGGRDIDLRRFASEGMELFGLLRDYRNGELCFSVDVASRLDAADAVYNRINASIDKHIEQHGISAPPGSVYTPLWQPPAERETLDFEAAGITSVVWCIGFSPDFGYIEPGVFNGRGHPVHTRGVTAQAGLYFLGLPWLYTWGSGRFAGIARDAEHVVKHLVEHQTKERKVA